MPRRSRIGGLADQGHRRVRRRARQHAGGLRPRGRPQQHRRLPAKRALHQAGHPVDDGTAGREHARSDGQRPDQHQERRRGDGHRPPASLRRARLADRRHRLRHGRRQKPPRRHSGDDHADGRRRPGLRRRARHGADRRGVGLRRVWLVDHPRRPHRGPHRRRGDRGKGSRLQPRHDAGAATHPAQSGLHHRPPRRRRDQRRLPWQRGRRQSDHRDPGRRPAATTW